MVFLDASAIIYLLEGAPPVRQATRIVLERLAQDRSENAIVVSALSLLECRVQPMRSAEPKRLELFDGFFADPGLIVIDLDKNVLDRATQLRAHHGIRTPDALQAASSLEADPNAAFVTGDQGFHKIPNLNVFLVEG